MSSFLCKSSPEIKTQWNFGCFNSHFRKFFLAISPRVALSPLHFTHYKSIVLLWYSVLSVYPICPSFLSLTWLPVAVAALSQTSTFLKKSLRRSWFLPKQFTISPNVLQTLLINSKSQFLWAFAGWAFASTKFFSMNLKLDLKSES